MHWSNSGNCQSYPTMITAFTVTNPQTLHHPNTEAWTPFYAMNIYLSNTRAYPLDQCGYLVVDIGEEICCISSLDTSRATGSDGVPSGANKLLQTHSDTTALLSKENILEYVPNVASNYCFMQAVSGSDTTTNATINTNTTTINDNTIYGMESVMVAAGSGCTSVGTYFSDSVTFTNYSTIICHPNATLVLYNGAPRDCRDAVPHRVFDLRGGGAFVDGVGAGNVYVEFVEASVDGGGKRRPGIGWTTYSPLALKVPVFKDWSEILAVMCISISILLNFFRLLYILRSYLTRTKKPQMIEMVIPATLMLYSFQRAFFTYYTGYISFLFYWWWIAFYGSTLTAATIAQAKFTYDFYFDHIFVGDFGRQKQSLLRTTVAPLMISVMFLVFGGGGFFGLIIIASSFTAEYLPPGQVLSFLKIWYFVNPIWVVLVLFGSMVPTYSLVQLLLTRKKVYRVGKHTKTFDFRSKLLFSFQLAVVVLYITTCVLQVCTAVLGNDRAFSSMLLVQVMLESMHSIASILVMESSSRYLSDKKVLRIKKRYNPSPLDTITRNVEPAVDRPIVKLTNKDGEGGLFVPERAVTSTVRISMLSTVRRSMFGFGRLKGGAVEVRPLGAVVEETGVCMEDGDGVKKVGRLVLSSASFSGMEGAVSKIEAVSPTAKEKNPFEVDGGVHGVHSMPTIDQLSSDVS